MRPLRPFALALLALALSPAAARADDARIVVRHRAGLDAGERAGVRAGADTALDHTLPVANTEVVTVEDGTRAQALAKLRRDPDVVYAETDDRVRLLTNDSFWPQLWGMFNPGTSGRVDADVDAEQAWTMSTGAGVTVAVVDTGVQAGHPDLGGRVTTGRNTVTGTTDTSDDNGHGTHVSGIIAATAGNGTGVAGIAPGATILPLKVFSGPYAYESDIASAFAYAGAHGAAVVNASLGGSGTSSVLDDAMRAYPDTLYVVAAGNDATNNDVSPVLPCVSSVANELCVGASTIDDTRASFSNYGPTTVDLFAPGAGIISTYPTSQYASMNGTSMATPYVTGTAALVAAKLGLKGAAIAARIMATVDHPAALAGLSVSGGRLNAARAVGAPTDAPTRPVVSSAVGGTNSATLTMATREADIAQYVVYDAATGARLGSATSPTIALGGLGAGVHGFTVVARNADGQDSPASAVTAATVQDPIAIAPPVAPDPISTTTTAPPPISRRSGGSGSAEKAPFTRPTIRTRHGRRTLTFRVTRTARVKVALARRTRRGYRTTARRTVRLVPGLQSLRITSRLLGMRVPRGRFRVTLSSGRSPAARVAFTRR